MVENVIWPAYLDGTRSRSEGRRVPVDDAIDDPTVDEIAEAVSQIGYDAVIDRDAAYPRGYEHRGCVRVDGDDDSKNDLLRAVAAYVDALRS